MSKAVMISIRPKWCNLIASGKKTIEVRKTRQKKEADAVQAMGNANKERAIESWNRRDVE